MDHQNREVNPRPIDASEEAALVADMKTAMPFLEELDRRNATIDFSPIVDGEHQAPVTITPFHKHRSSHVDLRSWTIDRKGLPRVLVTQRGATAENPLRFRFEEIHRVGEDQEEVSVPASPDTARQTVQILLNAAKRSQEQLMWAPVRERKPSRLAAMGHHVLSFFKPQHT